MNAATEASIEFVKDGRVRNGPASFPAHFETRMEHGQSNSNG